MRDKSIRGHIIHVLLTFVVFSGTQAFCQEPAGNTLRSIDELKQVSITSVGKDPVLMNGLKYNHGYGGVTGDPFLFPEQRKGTVVVKGISFDNQEIRFDLLNNALILNYSAPGSSTERVVLTRYWIDRFIFGNMIFRKGALYSDTSRYVEVIFEGKVSCYMDWKKEIKLGSGSDIHAYYFTDPQKQGFLQIRDQQVPFRSKRSFLKHFEKNNRKLIRNFIKERRFRFRKADTGEMRELLAFINQNI